MKSSIILDIIKEFSNSDISKLHLKYKKLEIDLDKTDKCDCTENNDIVIVSPIVGKIYSIKIKPGKKVKKGDTICVIESMKTFNEIKAENDYIVDNIYINENDFVECNQKIVSMRKLND